MQRELRKLTDDEAMTVREITDKVLEYERAAEKTHIEALRVRYETKMARWRDVLDAYLASIYQPQGEQQ